MYILRHVFTTMLALLAFPAYPQSSESSSSMDYGRQLKRVQELEAKQKELLNELNSRRERNGEPPLSMEDLMGTHAGRGESAVIVRGGVAETMITPNAHDVEKANFYASVREKIVKEGTCHFPSKGGKKLYGELVISIPISEDGAIYQKAGGARVERSSGNRDLDTSALRIVKSSEPFVHIPENQRKVGYENVWTVISRFDFKRVKEEDSPVDCAK